MSWNSRGGVTGSNNVPLGNRRRFGNDSASESPAPAPEASAQNDKRGRSPVREMNPDGTRKRRKRNRWGDANNKAAGLMGLTTAIQSNMTAEQLDAYTLNLRIEEISAKLRINDVVPADADRSPSPPPQYDNFGRRVNTRDQRYRKRLEEERHRLVEKAMKTIPNYTPPQDYRRPNKTQEKIYVPVNDYPEINFIGLLIGPRGNTLKKMESESGAKIAIRGKGSVKEGKGRSDAAHSSNQEEDLHCLIMADTEEKVNKAKKLINNIIETAASIPEAQNELKRNQLRELAALNGTLRDDENQACQNCGQIGHRKYDCPERQNFTANIICRICGNAGHMARDCTDRPRGAEWRNGPPRGGARNNNNNNNMDRDYESLMQDIGAGGSLTGGQQQQMLEAGPGSYNDSSSNRYGGTDNRDELPPWQRGPTGAPAPWSQPSDDPDGSGSAFPPWAAGGNGGGDNYGYPQQSGYNNNSNVPPPPPGGLPWQQPPAPGAQQSYGYGGYSSYDQPSIYGQAAPPAPSGLPPWAQSHPPPPPIEDAPPPPPSEAPPPPPPPGA